ncbi:flagella basal body P-ring formation protein FlgA [Novosphingobium sp.]|uniref:flagella basal body P-ring formation protein FlgA n=1 Tax=Novosphingobium sp. TaxID=1874826 RepID=UPI0022BBCD5F|nr:flagella basal body P-ring formation protein FlgA [Novosphingobium sp.]MCZ8018073.1 flagella basal body P-ring formation protein FlgA [Novosphingobium sp.]MCZ8034392.1 flagella basal body P-ring formation protein FlgA [Novosphingobium sp.]MCZ8052360.1 flagella basal body P-ring formation protein FlgA [Novosphingobium sp.]MCZ8061225.1 flagella basal body P-ring formation protein FlgA [Novosphingobium sp.]MCZ8232856.1 flagella basal body P-ring formation protein FlgA [Novosphingobium sp.]
MKALVPLALALLAAPALANAPVDLAALDRAVATFTGLPIGQPGGAAAPLDRRLRLARCPAEPLLSWHGTRREAVQLRCPVAGGWTLYVPVMGNGAGLAQPPLVQRGDAVSIVVAGDGFALSQPGEALEGGAGGTWIKVRGLAPKAPVLRGRVLRPGVVGVELP